MFAGVFLIINILAKFPELKFFQKKMLKSEIHL